MKKQSLLLRDGVVLAVLAVAALAVPFVASEFLMSLALTCL